MARLLIMDDDSSICGLYKDLLGDLYELEFANSGKAGFDKSQHARYDLIIADLNMPDWDGAQAIAAIDYFNPVSKYIIVSGYVDDQSYAEVLADIPNIVCKIQKPFTNNLLLESIASALSS